MPTLIIGANPAVPVVTSENEVEMLGPEFRGLCAFMMAQPGSTIVRCEVNPGPKPPRPRDERGRFARRIGVTVAPVTSNPPRWTVVSGSAVLEPASRRQSGER